MTMKQTQRGFLRREFSDANDEPCSIQESSACREEGLIWLGVNKVKPMVFRPGQGWDEIPLPTDGNVLISGRMHLTQSMVRELLPELQRFAETGGLGDE